MAFKPSALQQSVLDLLSQHPDGITITDIRLALGLSAEQQQHLDKRIRELYPHYYIDRPRRGGKTLYVLRGPKPEGQESPPVDRTTRARILHLAAYRCQMCGRTPEEDGVKLQVDHKIPREWGGSNEDDNLWATCSTCNEGKRNFFASITDPRIQTSITYGSVHVRIGELLKAFAGEPVPKTYLQIVAYTHDDWEKRLRELRELGWKYKAKKRKEAGRVRTYFALTHWEPWPDDPARAIRDAERAKGKAR